MRFKAFYSEYHYEIVILFRMWFISNRYKEFEKKRIKKKAENNFDLVNKIICLFQCSKPRIFVICFYPLIRTALGGRVVVGRAYV